MALEVFDLGEDSVAVGAHALFALRPCSDACHGRFTSRRAISWSRAWVGLPFPWTVERQREV